MKIINPKICVICKGRLWCGLKSCPILEKRKILISNANQILKKSIEGFSYSIFVGRNNYPKVPVGFLNSERVDIINDPKIWFSNNFKIRDILNERISLINAKTIANVSSSLGLEDPLVEISMAKNKVSSYVELKKLPQINIRFYFDYYPMGPSSPLRKIEINENPKIFYPIEKVYYDDDMKAEDAIWYLYRKKVNFYKIPEIFSAGLVGTKRKRKLVPTRWAITAVDSIISNKLLSKIKDFDSLDCYYFAYHEYLGNIIYYIIFPKFFFYELIEFYEPEASWNISKKIYVLKDYETNCKNPPSKPNTAGAYYATRLAFLEFLYKIKRRGSAICIREITRDYYLPLGIWVVRETARSSLLNVKEFDSLENLLNFLRKNFRKVYDIVIKNSYILKYIRSSLEWIMKK